MAARCGHCHGLSAPHSPATFLYYWVEVYTPKRNFASDVPSTAPLGEFLGIIYRSQLEANVSSLNLNLPCLRTPITLHQASEPSTFLAHYQVFFRVMKAGVV